MPDTPASEIKAQSELAVNNQLLEVVEVLPRKPAPADGSPPSDASAISNESASPIAVERAVESIAGDNASDEGAVSPDSADAQQLATRRNLLPRCWAAVATHVGLVAGCAASLLVGSGLGYLVFTPASVESSPAISSEPYEERASSSVRFVATIMRRNEPLKPLVPFDDLDQAVVELGRRLFHEPALSGNGRMSCASCHALAQAGTSQTALPRGVNGQKTQFNPPSVLNAALNFAYGWEGRFATLEEQLDDPISRPDELGSSWERVLKFLDSDPSYCVEFRESFGGKPTRESVATALASYQRSLLTPGSQFDQWLAGDEDALNADEFGGYYLFKKLGCINCHQGAGVGGTMFQPLGVAKAFFASPSDTNGLGRFAVTEHERDRHMFRVPALRNVAATAPYLHDGRAKTLEEVVAVMLEFQCGESVNSEDVRRLTAFLKTLSGKLPNAP